MEDLDIEQIIEKYSESVRVVCRKYYLIGGNEDDLFQEGMIGFLQALAKYDKSRGGIDSESFKKFALMCAKRQILDAIKHENIQRNSPLDNSVCLEDEHADLLGCGKTVDPEDVYLRKEHVEEKIKNISKQLSDFENSVFQLYIQGKELTKIADMLGKDVKSVENTIQRIKMKANKEKK